MLYYLFPYLMCFLQASVFAEDDGCQPQAQGRYLVTSVQVIVQSINILASYAHDTTVRINPNFNLTVTDAPVSLDVLATYKKTSTYVQMVDA